MYILILYNAGTEYKHQQHPSQYSGYFFFFFPTTAEGYLLKSGNSLFYEVTGTPGDMSYFL